MYIRHSINESINVNAFKFKTFTRPNPGLRINVTLSLVFFCHAFFPHFFLPVQDSFKKLVFSPSSLHALKQLQGYKKSNNAAYRSHIS